MEIPQKILNALPAPVKTQFLYWNTFDPQTDFISGAFPAPGAAKAMDRLADYIVRQDGHHSIQTDSNG